MSDGSGVYKVGIVGESNYQPAIRSLRLGDRVNIVREHGNTYDSQALAVETLGGLTIGYISRESWLRQAIHDEGQGCAATIGGVTEAGGGFLGVVLDVRLVDAPTGSRCYQPFAPSPPAPATRQAPLSVAQGRAIGLVAGAALLGVAFASAESPADAPDAEIAKVDVATGRSLAAAEPGKFGVAEGRELLSMRRVSPNVEAAPPGFPKTVAAEAIARKGSLACTRVTDALRVGDGSIVARCAGGETYRVGKLFELPGTRAMRCADVAPLTQQYPC